MNNRGPIPNPDLRSILDQERDNTGSGLNCVRIGTIVGYNPSTQSASVQLVNPSVVFNAPSGPTAIPTDPQTIPIPPLVQVPVWVLSGGKAFLGMPIAPGDPCIVLLNDRDLDPWWTNGTTGAPPNSDRMHSLADGIAIVGIRPATKPIAGLPSDGEHVTFGNDQQTMLGILNKIVLALTALNLKTGPDASAAIVAVTTAAGQLFQ